MKREAIFTGIVRLFLQSADTAMAAATMVETERGQ